MNTQSDIAAYLAATGSGIYDTIGTTSTIFTPQLPASPASALSVRTYGDAPPGPYLLDSALPEWVNPRVQIQARDPDSDTAEARCYAAWKTLVGTTEITLGGVRYYTIRSVNGPMLLYQDKANNWIYSCNLQIMKGIS